ncbi:MAG TPA: sugar phosphate isomerase/epimerase family protein [Fimbriimonadaceae bacterium]|nr:sugar phosphate isomerase/epimerase family protein [Fimbriimonadaceae bacterium]
MRLGVSMWSYVQAYKEGRIDIPGFIREAQRIGAEGVELLDFFAPNPAADREAAKAALAETGLVCGVFSVGQNFARPSVEERQAALDRVKFGVDEAVALGAGTVRVFAGDVSEGITFDEARGWIIEGLAEGSRYAHDHGVRLALENHGSLAGRSDQVKGIIEDVRAACGNDALGANPDTGNFLLVGQASHEAILDVAPYAYMVHFKDFTPAPADHEGWAYTSLSGDKFVGTAIGEGSVDLAQCVAALKAAGFDGWLNVEYEAEEDPFTGVERSMATARRFVEG